MKNLLITTIATLIPLNAFGQSYIEADSAITDKERGYLDGDDWEMEMDGQADTPGFVCSLEASSKDQCTDEDFAIVAVYGVHFMDSETGAGELQPYLDSWFIEDAFGSTAGSKSTLEEIEEIMARSATPVLSNEINQGALRLESNEINQGALRLEDTFVEDCVDTGVFIYTDGLISFEEAPDVETCEATMYDMERLITSSQTER